MAVHSEMTNPISSGIDLNQDGKQFGHLRLPHSVHRSAYGWIPIPIVSIRNGDGPVVLVMGGNHGDEYEGQAIVAQLCRDIAPEAIRGQLLLMPMANYPAAMAGRRTSPLDEGNLNRSFPGHARGTPTEIVADYIEGVLLARAQYLVDLHSGGSSLIYDRGYALTLEPGDADRARVQELLMSFGMPKGYLHVPSPVNSSAAADRNGAVPFLLELGGGGALSHDLAAAGREGVLRFLGHIGLLRGALVPPPPARPTLLLRTETDEHFVYALDEGIYEPLADLGEVVQKGQPAARIHFPSTPLREPATLFFEREGYVACKRAIARVVVGDCLFQLASER